MKAEELMIGDWVLKDMNYLEEDPMYTRLDYQPYKIENGEDIDLACESNCLGNADVYQPIPLTEEILKANGFTSEVVVDTIHFVSEDRRLILQSDAKYLNSNRKWYIHIDSIAMSSIGSAEFTYVNELQHILRLFGFDTDIKLEP